MYLVDAYNAVHAGRSMAGIFTSLTVFKLCQHLTASPKRLSVTLILDGRPKPDEPGENEFPEIHLIYSGTSIPADSIIARMVERGWESRRAQKIPKLTVVSNDRAVTAHAKANHARTLTCETFLKLLITPSASKKHTLPAKKTGAPISPGETDHWLREFGFLPPEPKTKPLENTDIEKLMGG